jgi:ParB/RepB/Spo0J family partition protein
MVRPKAKRYDVIYGDRRFAEAKRLGHKEIDVIVTEADDRESLLRHIVENCSRRDFDPLEESEAYWRLKKQGYATERIGKLVGKSSAHVSNRLSLLKLPEKVQDQVRDKKIPASLAIRLSHMVPKAMQENVAETMLRNKYDYMRSLQYLDSLEATFKDDKLREKFELPSDKVTEKQREKRLQEKKAKVEEKLMEAFGVNSINVIHLRFWQLLLQAEPKLRTYTVFVKRAELIESLEADLQMLKAKSTRTQAVTAPHS